MMVLIIIVLIVSLSVNGFQWYRRREESAELNQAAAELERLLKETSRERLLVMTDWRALRVLLVQINRLIDYKDRLDVEHVKSEESIRKMISNISHDLKTPLTVMLGYAEMLQHHPDMPETERRQLLGKVHDKTNELILFINAFFDLARLESDDLLIELNIINVTDSCQRNMLQFYDLMMKEGITADIDLPEAPLYVQANDEALDRVLQNLISNALYHGADGKTLGLSVKELEDYVELTVWDRGKGILDHDQNRIFERLFTLEESRNKAFQGSGLGLTITKRLVEAMGGTIEVASMPGLKTAFTVKLKHSHF